MSNLNISIPHNLSGEEARERIKKLLGNLQAEQSDNISDVKEEWQGNTGQFSFRAKGFDLSGIIDVSPSQVQISARLPFAVSLFKGKITQVITEKATQLLA